MGWPMLIVEGVEADDVIGTLVKQAERENMRCIISTGDKDIAQLVTPHVTLVNTMTNERLDEAGVLTKFGVTPARMLDYLALVGDATDNIPGVDKVGPKTAVKWLTQYGNLDNLVAACQRNPWRGRGKFAQGAGLAEHIARTVGDQMRCADLPMSLHDLGAATAGYREAGGAVRAPGVQNLVAGS